MSGKIISPQNITFHFEGPALDYGRLPAFFYFALSAEQSLYTSPYNSPVVPFAHQACRVFSVTLPDHGVSPMELTAIKEWGHRIKQGEYVLEEFINDVAEGIKWLIDKGYILDNKIALGGLSRGGFIAIHLSAKLPQVTLLLAFAPLTRLDFVEEFQIHKDDVAFQRRLDHLNPMNLIDHLTHLKCVRFYIGNRDTRVNTDACYQFIRKLTDTLHKMHARHSHIELFITQSIGFKGHGTQPSSFEEGSSWLKHHLLEVN